MATENKGVMVYITPELETVLEKYCIERNITRKTRDGHVFASLGTGIVQYLKSQLLGGESNSGIAPSQTLSKDDVSDIVNAAIAETLAKLDPLSNDAVMMTVKREITPLTESLSELETYTQDQFKAVREELKQATSDRTVTTESIALLTTPPTDKDPSVKSWAEFFKIIGMDALTATDAQKKENIDTRTEQIEQGLQAAKEQDLGDWAVKVAGRSFVRVGD
jgi:hypothetical protein